jgi:hypothetical protein
VMYVCVCVRVRVCGSDEYKNNCDKVQVPNNKRVEMQMDNEVLELQGGTQCPPPDSSSVHTLTHRHLNETNFDGRIPF